MEVTTSTGICGSMTSATLVTVDWLGVHLPVVQHPVHHQPLRLDAVAVEPLLQVVWVAFFLPHLSTEARAIF